MFFSELPRLSISYDFRFPRSLKSLCFFSGPSEGWLNGAWDKLRSLVRPTAGELTQQRTKPLPSLHLARLLCHTAPWTKFCSSERCTLFVKRSRLDSTGEDPWGPGGLLGTPPVESRKLEKLSAWLRVKNVTFFSQGAG